MSVDDFSEDYSSKEYSTTLFNYENDWSRNYCWHSRRTLSTVEDEHYQDLNLDGLLDYEDEQKVVNPDDNEKKNEAVPISEYALEQLPVHTSTHQLCLDTADLVFKTEQLEADYENRNSAVYRSEPVFQKQQQVVEFNFKSKKEIYEDIRVDCDKMNQIPDHIDKVAEPQRTFLNNHQDSVEQEMCSSSNGTSYLYLESPAKRAPNFNIVTRNQSQGHKAIHIPQVESHVTQAVMSRKREYQKEVRSKNECGSKPSKKAKRSTIVIERWIQGKQTETVAKSERPSLPFSLLCSLACLNSSTGKVSTSDVYSFVLHHWCYYRFCNPNWRNSVRHNLADEKVFGKEKGKDHVSFYYLLKPQEVKYTSDHGYIQHDPRGENFYSRLLKGEIGLPRQLFYYVVGLCAPQFAGPENSALFYHLLSIKYIPEKFSNMFREYRQEHNGREPKFVEEYVTYTTAMLKVEQNVSFGINVINGTEQRLLSTKELDVFHFEINCYYELQKYHQFVNNKNWTTPLLDNAI